MLVDPDVRVLTLVGPGGVGKTRLALELAQLHGGNFADGALFVGLEKLDDPSLIATELVAALGRREGHQSPAAVMPMAVVALWLVARYAAEVDRDTAIRLMLEAQRIYMNLDARIWPESDVRDETLFALGLEALPTGMSLTDTHYTEALAFAAAWLDDRAEGEVVNCVRPERSPLAPR